MADTSPMIQQGVELVQRATVEDEAGHLEAALKLYLLGIEAFMTVLKRERNDSVKRTLFLKLQSYMSRAEQLKKLLRNAAAPAPPLALPEVPSFDSAPPLTHSLLDDSLLDPSPPIAPRTHPSASVSAPRSKPPQQTLTPSADLELSWDSLLSDMTDVPRAPTARDGELRLDGEEGHSFESLFGAYALGAARVVVREKNNNTSIEMWVHFAEFVATSGAEALHVCMPMPADQAGVELALLALQSALGSRGVRMTYEWDSVVVSQIEFEGSGVVIEGPQGIVDIFESSPSAYTLGAHNLQFRATKRRTLRFLHQ